MAVAPFCQFCSCVVWCLHLVTYGSDHSEYSFRCVNAESCQSKSLHHSLGSRNIHLFSFWLIVSRSFPIFAHQCVCCFLVSLAGFWFELLSSPCCMVWLLTCMLRERLQEALKGVPIDRLLIISSPFARAQETAEISAAALGIQTNGESFQVMDSGRI